MNKIAFVDFDGVLNMFNIQGEDLDRELQRQEEARAKNDHLVWKAACLDPDLVGRLNQIVDQTGALVVVHSSWRRHWSVEDLQTILGHAGFTGKVLDKAPLLEAVTESGLWLAKTRGETIQAWMDQNGTPERFVILDDVDEMGSLKEYLVQTESNKGLQESHVARAVEILNSGVTK